MKKFLGILLSVCMTFSLMPAHILSTSATVKGAESDDEENYCLYSESYQQYYFEGEAAELSVYVEDDNDRRVDTDNPALSFKWYAITRETETGVDVKSDVLGTGSSYQIAYVSQSDFWREDHKKYYSCELYVNGRCEDTIRIYLYDAADSFEGISSTREVPAWTTEEQLSLSANFYSVYADEYYISGIEGLREEDLSIKWYRETYYENTGQTVRSGELGTGRTYALNFSASDFSTDTVKISYVYEVYYKDIQVAKGGYVFREKVIDPPSNITFLGQDILKDSVLSDTLPEGVSYDVETHTLTLSDYQGKMSDSVNMTDENVISQLIWTDGILNIELIGKNVLIADVESIICDGIYARSYLTIDGGGSLDLQFLNAGSVTGITGIEAAKRLEIKDCSISIESRTKGMCYGITLSPWENYAGPFNGENCGVYIDNASVRINNTTTTETAVNAGIDAQDADLSITQSDVDIELTGGNVIFGLSTGLYDYNGAYGPASYGGKLSIDETSQVNVSGNGDGEVYSTYFYMDDVRSPYIYAGSDSNKLESNRNNILIEGDYPGRTDCLYPYLEFTSHHWIADIVKATAFEDGHIVRRCEDCGEISVDAVIPRIGGVKTVEQSYYYTGEAVEPDVVVTDSSGAVISEDEYIIHYQNNVNAGRGTVTVDFTGNYYSGSISVAFDIVKKEESSTEAATTAVHQSAKNKPSVSKRTSASDKYAAKKRVVKKRVKITKIKAKKWYLKVSWKKIKGVDGYILQYSRSKKFRHKQKEYISANRRSASIFTLKSKKKYYFRVRSYVYAGYGCYYSKWSKVKSKRTK